MNKLNEILFGLNYNIVGNDTIEINELKIDSKSIQPNDVFIAIKGTSVDGHTFIDTVIQKGAKVIVCEQLPNNINDSITYIQVEDTRKIAALLACNFYHHPSKKTKLVGVTGTNGKTTIATLLYQLYRKAGFNVGLISTIENKINEEIISATHTTPNPIALNQLLDMMVQQNCDYVFMEVSSHAAHQDRIAGLNFAGAIFSNISHDHLDYHKTFDEYIKAKKIFFDQLPSSAFALVNIDDKRGEVMLQNTLAKRYTYALKSLADFNFKILENNLSGLVLKYKHQDIYTHQVGNFNAYNLLAILATAILLGMDEQKALGRISELQSAEGRFDIVKSNRNNIVGIVDYAHTPDALKNVIDTINTVRTGNESLITIIGCGGNRDKAKRPEMALIAATLSTKVILTSDNPRDEEPEQIIAEMQAGIPPHLTKKVVTILDRKEAIKTGVLLAQANDVILLAGKGHEKYQEVKGIKHPFDDKQILSGILNNI
ncbi:MAG: UDP-N-acetylmuramoyl-L-alanyl-D-glutamate--2,6-diaminopimelate ligase [Chitinophagales bacterium]